MRTRGSHAKGVCASAHARGSAGVSAGRASKLVILYSSHRSSPVGRPSNSPSIGSSSLRSRTLVSSSRQSSFARGNSTVSDDARTWVYSGSASASPAYASSPVAPPAVKSSKGKDKMSPVRMPAAGSSQVQVSRGSPRAQRQIKMEFDDDGTEIIMPALPFTAQSERQVWLDEAPRGPWPGPKNGGSMPSVTGVFKAWSAKKYAKVASVKSYKGGGKMCIFTSILFPAALNSTPWHL